MFHPDGRSLRLDVVHDDACRYDTRGATEPVLPGWGTGNEMCLLGVFMVPVFE